MNYPGYIDKIAEETLRIMKKAVLIILIAINLKAIDILELNYQNYL